MNYAEHIRDTYLRNKDKEASIRREQGLSYILTLEDKLKDGYESYKRFCIDLGISPKSIINFLREDVI